MDTLTRLTPAYETTQVEDIAFAEVLNANGQPETLHLDIYQQANAPATLRPAEDAEGAEKTRREGISNERQRR
jgi:hypothetical protein